MPDPSAEPSNITKGETQSEFKAPIVQINEASPPKKAPRLSIKEKFLLENFPEGERDSVIERQISPYEKTYTLGGHSYIVWAEGPKVNEVYRVESEPTPEQIAELPTVDNIQNQIVKRLEEIDAQEKIRRELAKEEAMDRQKVSALDASTGTKLADLYIYLHKLYHGDKRTIGLEQAQLFDLEGEGQKYYDLVLRLNDLKKDGYKGYLNELISANNLSIKIDPYMVDFYEKEAFNRFYFGKGLKEENKFSNQTDPVTLTHHSYGNALSGVVEIGGLAAKNYMESHGLKKYFGGELGGSAAFPPNGVFFNESPEGNPSIAVGWGRKIGLEFPMVYGISRSHEQGLKTWKGAYGSERFARDFVPMEHISHIFVPGFKTRDVSETLNAHSFGQVAVLPLGT